MGRVETLIITKFENFLGPLSIPRIPSHKKILERVETLVKINKLYKKAFVRNRYLPPSSGVRGAEAAKFINLVKKF